MQHFNWLRLFATNWLHIYLDSEAGFVDTFLKQMVLRIHSLVYFIYESFENLVITALVNTFCWNASMCFICQGRSCFASVFVVFCQQCWKGFVGLESRNGPVDFCVIYIRIWIQEFFHVFVAESGITSEWLLIVGLLTRWQHSPVLSSLFWLAWRHQLTNSCTVSTALLDVCLQITAHLLYCCISVLNWWLSGSV